MGKVIKMKRQDVAYNPPFSIRFGIDKKVVENAKVVLAHTRIPPSGRGRRHYHIHCDAGGYVLKGRVRILYGPDHEIEEMDAEEGDFFFNPMGEIHAFLNLSDSESAELIAFYDRVGSTEDAGTVFVEPPLE
jgi:uncharacterized RmlC-like cupin family protein